jgi:PAS domain S-box-containing protein
MGEVRHIGPSAEDEGLRAWRLPASPFPMWIFDPQTGVIVGANDAAVCMYGYTREELLACRMRDLCEARDPSVELLTTLHVKVSPWICTAEQRRKDGTTFEADIAMTETGDPQHAAIMVLANPTVAGQECVVESARAKTLPGRSKTVARLREPELGGVTALVSVGPRELIQRVLDRLWVRAEAKDIDLVVHCTCGPVWVQPEAFEEVIYELLDNAVRATPRGYPVIVDVRDTREGDVVWQIQDTGEGMAERGLAQLGRPPAAGRPGGAGHGVARAWALIEGHGGSLRFESAPGVGTTASVWLPGACERQLRDGPMA